MAYYREKLKTGLVRLAALWLCQRSWPHLLMFVACGCGFLAWWSLTQSLAFIPWFWLRYGLCAIGAYLAWFLVVGFWFNVQPVRDTSHLVHETDRESNNRPLTPNEERALNRDAAHNWTRDFSDQLGREFANDPRAAFGFFLFMLLGGGVITALFLWATAPRFLGEMLVGGGKVVHQSTYSPQAKPWYKHLFNHTAAFAAPLVIHYVLVAWAAQVFRPNAVGLMDALSR